MSTHRLERGTDLAPYHGLSLTASGPHARVFWPVSPRFGIGQEKKMQPGEAVRMEMRASLDGYWADSARTLTMGQPDPDQAKGYAHLRELTAAALSALRTGARACDVYAAVSARAAELGADWISGLGAGHGVGVTPYEAPYLTAWDETRLEAGMVLVIDLAVRLPGGEILRAGHRPHPPVRGAHLDHLQPGHRPKPQVRGAPIRRDPVRRHARASEKR